jgi:transposase
MQDRDLFSQLLGLRGPWKVADIKVDYAELRVDIWVGWPAGESAPCPVCEQVFPVYDHRGERSWRHLDTMQFRTILHCQIPRIQCPTHGVKSIEVPWAEDYSRFTALFERFAIDVLLGCQNATKAAALLRLSWDEVHEIQERAANRGLSRRGEEDLVHIGIDEKSFLRAHSYITLICDIDRSRVIEVSHGRNEAALTEILNAMTDAQKTGVKAAAVDMWGPYLNAVTKTLPDADIVHDKFHIVKHLGEAVDKVRKSENSLLCKEGITDLKGTKYLWLTNPSHWTDMQKGIFQEIKGKQLKVGRAWSIKEMFSSLWDYIYPKSARNFFKRWYFWATHSRLDPIIRAAKTLKRHVEGILAYLKHRITNAVTEGLNSKIQQIKSAARGFRNFNHYRIAILFYCGKLDLYPHKCR